jgi:hypothetical protein
MKDIFETMPLKTMPESAKSDLVLLPPGNTWVNIRALGAKGDGITDDTAIFRKAIDEHRAIYLPSGYYVISDTLTLRADTVLIGLHPLATQIDLLDRTAAYQGVGGPKPMIETSSISSHSFSREAKALLRTRREMFTWRPVRSMFTIRRADSSTQLTCRNGRFN